MVKDQEAKATCSDAIFTKIMPKFVGLDHVGMHVSNVVIIDYDIEIFFKLIS